jgi:ABC-type polysaccharide/polyol phosphate export permease
LLTKNGLQKAYQDVIDAVKHWRIWILLGWQDIQLRYRRSVLGPFWLTLSMAITIYSMGFLYGHLFKIDLNTYFPYLAAGILSWNLISTSLIEATDIFAQSESYIKQIRLPYFCFIFRMIFRNLVIFLHNLIAFIPLIFFLSIPLNGYSLLFVPALLVLALNIAVYGSILAIIGARYRDIAPIIASLIQVAFFLTPIMWMPKLLPERFHYAMQFNPFAHFITLLRQPLLGQAIPLNSLMAIGILSLGGLFILGLLFSRYRSRIIFWL